MCGISEIPYIWVSYNHVYCSPILTHTHTYMQINIIYNLIIFI
jgi:hypothetical protein